MSVREYIKEKNTEVLNIEFNCKNYLSYDKFIKEINNKIKEKDINSIFVKIEASYTKEEVSDDKFFKDLLLHKIKVLRNVMSKIRRTRIVFKPFLYFSHIV